MITYELAKQLKEKGYEGDFNLTSLIEAIGDSFYKLELNDKSSWPEQKWSAFEFRSPDIWKDGEFRYTIGPTLEIAVAKLWLRVYKNKT